MSDVSQEPFTAVASLSAAPTTRAVTSGCGFVVEVIRPVSSATIVAAVAAARETAASLTLSDLPEVAAAIQSAQDDAFLDALILG